jgi:hypothetical protein
MHREYRSPVLQIFGLQIGDVRREGVALGSSGMHADAQHIFDSSSSNNWHSERANREISSTEESR